MADIASLETAIGITFADKNFLNEALTHRSYLNEHPEWQTPHNERLEYLGDAVLELAVSEVLFNEFPAEPEGRLTVLRAALVNYQSLSRVAGELSLENFIRTSKGERGDTAKAREVILANAMEALIGAIYLDRGFDAARTFIDRFVMIHLPEILTSKSYRDAKSELQEVVQERLKMTPAYKVLDESGPAHRRTFRVGVYSHHELLGEGEGSSKQEAETEAARNALAKLGA